MRDEADIAAAIAAYPAQSAAALAAVQLGRADPIRPEAIATAAALLGRKAEELWVEQLRHRDLLDRFAEALGAQGVALGVQGVALAPPADFGDHVTAALVAFLPRVLAFRCRVLVNGEVRGTGCLVGPSTVLTASHVLGDDEAGNRQAPPGLKVRLSDNTEQALAYPPLYESPAERGEYRGIAPTSDAAVAGRSDVVLLRMGRPAGAHLGFAPLPPAGTAAGGRRVLFLAHYPGGQDQGLGIGAFSKIRGMTARMRHTIATGAGSSGGACFDGGLLLAGIHQAAFGRFVPCGPWIEAVRPAIEQDRSPSRLWSLDRTETGPLVIGRDLFSAAIAAAMPRDAAVRGVRQKRLDVLGGATGLAFSHDILAQLLLRRGAEHLLVRIPFDAPVADFAADLRRRTVAAGLALPGAAAAPGVAAGQSAAEATARADAAILSGAIGAAADAAGRTVWYFADNPNVALSEPTRLAFEAFVAAALSEPRIRLVLAGFETMSLPGAEFATPGDAAAGGQAGLVVEFLGGFTRPDILGFLTLAAEDLMGGAVPAVIANAADVALNGLQAFNGRYPAAELRTVADRLRPQLRVWREQGQPGP